MSQEDDYVVIDRPYLALWAMLASAGLVMTATVIGMAALPVIGRELLATQTELQWVVDITPTALAALLLPAGAVLDRYGRRTGLIIGFVILAASLTWSGVADSPLEMIASRFATGIGAAIVFPGTLTTIRAIVPPENRDTATGYWAAATLGGGTAGFLITGVTLETGLWWGAFFVVTALITLGCLVATLIAVPETREADPPPLDPLGALLSLFSVGGLVLATIEIPVRGLLDPVVAAGYLVGAVAGVGFLARQARRPRPMLDVALFRNPQFTGGFVALFLFFGGCYGWFLLSFQYSGYVMGYSVLGAGAAMLPNALSTVPLSALSPRLSARFGWVGTTTVAFVVLAFGAVLIALAGDNRSFWSLAVGFFVFGIGIGLGNVAPTQAIVDSLPRAKQGLASAVNDLSRELGAAAGIAVVGSVFNVAYRAHVASDGTLAHLPRLAAAVKDSPAVGLASIAARPHHAAVVHEAVATATIAGWQVAFGTIAAAFLVVAVFVWFGVRPRISAPRRLTAT